MHQDLFAWWFEIHFLLPTLRYPIVLVHHVPANIDTSRSQNFVLETLYLECEWFKRNLLLCLSSVCFADVTTKLAKHCGQYRSKSRLIHFSIPICIGDLSPSFTKWAVACSKNIMFVVCLLHCFYHGHGGNARRNKSPSRAINDFFPCPTIMGPVRLADEVMVWRTNQIGFVINVMPSFSVI